MTGRAAVVSVLALLAATPVAAQLKRPEGWKLAFDRPSADSTVDFAAMPPGWHVTSGPATVLYNPATTASGEYAVESQMFLFPGTSQEGFGIVLAGKELESAGRRWTAVVLRRDGRYAVLRWSDGLVSEVVAWTAHAAIPPATGAESPVKYVLRVEAAAGGTATVLVNGTAVGTFTGATGGGVGLRVGRDLNLHITSLAVTAGTGPPRP